MSTLLQVPLLKEDPAGLAFAWLLESGIQDPGETGLHKGGVNAWFDLRTQSYQFFYSEITGYAVNAFLFWYEVSGDTSYLDAARDAVDWLLNAQYPESGLIKTRVNHEVYHRSYFDSWIFTFDQWMVIYGLANLSEVMDSSPYLEHAEKMARFLIRHTVRRDGFFYPLYDVEHKQPVNPRDKWSRQSGSFHAKALLALSKLHQLTKKEEYQSCAVRLAEKTLSVQKRDGRFVTQNRDGSTHLHPHLYTLEGLLALGFIEKKDALVRAAEKGLKWVFDHQATDGSIYSFTRRGRFVPYVRADILAQTLRLGAVLVERGFLSGYRRRLSDVREKLLTYQILEGSQKGGFLYGQEQDGTVHYHVNAWVTMFASQALWIHDHFLPSNRRYNISFFV